jgi:two-component system sensor histidine kinase BarA
MADKPFHRVLGETDLERRCRLLLGFCLFAVISTGFIWYGQQADRLIQQQDRIKGRMLVDTILIETHWPVWASSKNLEDILRGQAESLHGQKRTWTFLRADALDSDSPHLDSFERQVLEQFLQSPRPKDSSGDVPPPFIERALSDQHQYEYYQPIYAKGDLCVHCHRQSVGQPNLKMNDLIAVVGVKFSTEATRREETKNRAILIATCLTTVALAIAGTFAIVRLVIFKQLAHLQGPESDLR